MTKRLWHIRLRDVLGSAFVCGQLALAPSPLRCQDTAALYQRGYEAYKHDDYIQALKYLYAYREIAVTPLPSPPRVGPELDAALTYSESRLDLAVRTRRALEQYGQITEVEVKASGKADDPSGRRVTVPLPAAPGSQKPTMAPPAARRAVIPKAAVPRVERARPPGAAVAVAAAPPGRDDSTIAALERERAGLLARVSAIDSLLAVAQSRPERR
jgi:hypothetical protein